MKRRLPQNPSFKRCLLAAGAAPLLAAGLFSLHGRAASWPEAPPVAESGRQTAVFAGGCFWGIEAVFEHVRGVESAVSGYTGGAAADARYETVGSGATGHAESVKVTYDPSQVGYGQLLDVFFSVAHDPTQLNRQGPDRGPQYRSEIFAANAGQERTAKDYIARLNAAKVFGDPVVTKVERLDTFYPAEDYHQDYAERNPGKPYIVIHDAPKVAALREKFPDLYR